MAVGGKGFTSSTFTSSGSFTAPAGVTQLILIGCGGGQAGQAGYGSGSLFPCGGKSAVPNMKIVTVTPSTTYVITIGDGGATTTGFNGAAGNAGTSTTFGALATFVAPNSTAPLYDSGTGVQISPSTIPRIVSRGWAAFAGAHGTHSGANRGGSGGGAGTTGPGGAGGNASATPGAGGAGTAATSTNFGAGGGAGGSDPGTTTGGGNGGAGAGGFLNVIWVEG